MNWWKHVMLMELRKILAYRSDFWITFLGQTLIQLLVARSLWQMIFASEGVKVMNGYSLEMMNLYYLIIPIGTRMLSGENIGFVSREIYEGTFTRYLLYPISVFQYKTLTYMTYSLFYGLQLFLLYSLYRLFFTTSSITVMDFSNLLLGVGLFLLASLTYLLMAMLIELIALWADNIWTLIVMLKFFVTFLGGGFVPLTFFPALFQDILRWTPFPYLIQVPAQTIMGMSQSQDIFRAIALLLIWALIFMELIKIVWKRGEKQYTGVGI